MLNHGSHYETRSRSGQTGHGAGSTSGSSDVLLPVLSGHQISRVGKVGLIRAPCEEEAVQQLEPEAVEAPGIAAEPAQGIGEVGSRDDQEHQHRPRSCVTSVERARVHGGIE